MKSKVWRTRIICAALVLGTAAGAAWASGTQGSETNPLVSLSYLTERVIPDILAKVDERIDARLEELNVELGEDKTASFLPLEVPAGAAVDLSAGTQLILRAGAARNTDSLTDLTDGVPMWGELKENHLYIATADGQRVTVEVDAVFLVQGRYTVEHNE